MKLIKNHSGIIIAIIWTLIAISLYGFRVLYTDRLRFLFLNWNIFLAWIAPLLALLICKINWKPKLRFVEAILVIAWLLFLPNSFYLITDFVHLYATDDIGLWFDILLLSVFAVLGVGLGYWSMLLLDNKYLTTVKFTTRWVIIVIVSFASSFGIYLGRFLRWNSWDVVNNYAGILSDAFTKIISPTDNPRTIGFTLILGLLIFAGYVSIRLMNNSK